MSRLCPVCREELQETKLHGETIDTCKSCNGTYFDKGELESIVQLIHFLADTPLEEEEIEIQCEIEKKRDLQCPVDGQTMKKQEIGSLVIDICSKCGGIWLDDGEIIALKLADQHIKENLQLYIRLAT